MSESFYEKHKSSAIYDFHPEVGKQEHWIKKAKEGCYVEKCNAPLYKIELPKAEGNVKSIRVRIHETAVIKGVECYHIPEVSSVATMVILRDKGFFSGHPFQPKINHRDFGVLTLANHHSDDKGEQFDPMFKSLIGNQDSMQFGVTNPISFAFYETNVSNSLGQKLVQSQGRVSFTPTGMKFPEHDYLYANSQEIDYPSVGSFKRLLELFSMQWDDCPLKDEDETPLDALIAFSEELASNALSGSVGLKDFISKYHLDRVFDYNDHESFETNFDRLGMMIRSLQPVRVGVYEGQHRLEAMHAAMTGHWNIAKEISSDLGHRRITYQSALEKYGGKFGLQGIQFPETQLFKKMAMRIGTPTDRNFGKGIMCYRDFGRQVTGVQGTFVCATAAKMLVAFATRLDFEGRVVADPYSFDKCWKLGAPDWKKSLTAKYAVIAESFCSFVENEGHCMVMSGQSQQWTPQRETLDHKPCELRAAVDKAMKSTNYNLAPDKVPKHSGAIVSLAKYACLSKNGRHRLIDLLDGAKEKYSQSRKLLDGKNPVTTTAWMLNYICYPMKYIRNHLEKVLMCELKVVQLLQWAKKEKKIISAKLNAEDANTDYSILCDYSGIAAVKNKMERIKEPDKVTLQSLFTDNDHSAAGLAHKKLLNVVFHMLFEDLIETVGAYGLNPVLLAGKKIIHIPAAEQNNDRKINRHLRMYLFALDRPVEGTKSAKKRDRSGEVKLPREVIWDPDEEMEHFYHQKEKGMETNGPKYLVEIAIQLWIIYIKEEFSIGSPKLKMLNKIRGSKDFLTGKTRELSGMRPTVGALSEDYEQLTGDTNGFLFYRELKFSDFLRRVLHDEVNTDDSDIYSAFHKHVKRFINNNDKAKSTFNKKKKKSEKEKKLAQTAKETVKKANKEGSSETGLTGMKEGSVNRMSSVGQIATKVFGVQFFESKQPQLPQAAKFKKFFEQKLLHLKEDDFDEMLNMLIRRKKIKAIKVKQEVSNRLYGQMDFEPGSCFEDLFTEFIAEHEVPEKNVTEVKVDRLLRTYVQLKKENGGKASKLNKDQVLGCYPDDKKSIHYFQDRDKLLQLWKDDCDVEEDDDARQVKRRTVGKRRSSKQKDEDDEEDEDEDDDDDDNKPRPVAEIIQEKEANTPALGGFLDQETTSSILMETNMSPSLQAKIFTPLDDGELPSPAQLQEKMAEARRLSGQHSPHEGPTEPSTQVEANSDAKTTESTSPNEHNSGNPTMDERKNFNREENEKKTTAVLRQDLKDLGLQLPSKTLKKDLVTRLCKAQCDSASKEELLEYRKRASEEVEKASEEVEKASEEQKKAPGKNKTNKKNTKKASKDKSPDSDDESGDSSSSSDGDSDAEEGENEISEKENEEAEKDSDVDVDDQEKDDNDSHTTL